MREILDSMTEAIPARVPSLPSERPPPADPELPLLNLVLADQRRRWQQRERVDVEVYLQQQPSLQANAPVVLDLIYNELLLREQGGETPQLCEYQQRFPTLAADLELLFEVDHVLQGPSLLSTPGHLAGQGPAVKTIAPPGAALSVPVIPGYEMLGMLGQGGMGVVYKARQVGANRIVALKIAIPVKHAEAEALARFKLEAESVARLAHPNIVQLYEVGIWNGLHFFSVEYVEGGSLDRYLQGTPLPSRDAAALAETMARTIQHAHDHGVIHRDLKPGNILLQEDTSRRGAETQRKAERRESQEDSARSPSSPSSSSSCLCASAPLHEGFFIPKITDFGLAKRLNMAGPTQAGAILGTPNYMSPEQALGQANRAGPLADVYALGAILYELLTGRPPFQAASVLLTLEQVRWQKPVPPAQLQPGVPSYLDAICLKCLQKEPQRRYGSALELAEALRRFREGEPSQPRPRGPLARLRQWCRRERSR